MSTEIFFHDLHQVLFQHISQCKTDLCIVSPFYTPDTVDLLCQIVSKKNLSCVFITTFDVTSTKRLNGLQKMLDANIKVYCEQSLHTKLYLCDHRLALLGSANFTHRGLSSDPEGNYEILLCIQDDAPTIQKLYKYAQSWIQDRFRITYDRIQEYIPIAEQCEQAYLPPPAPSKVPSDLHLKRKRSRQFEYQHSVSLPNVWVKVVGDRHREESIVLSESSSPSSSRLYRNTEFGTDTFVFFPGTKNIHIQAGDTVYFAYLGKSPSGDDETYIFARGTSKGYDQSQSLSKQLPQEWRSRRWPQYMQFDNVEVYNGAVNAAIPMSELRKRSPGEKLRVRNYCRLKNQDIISFLDTECQKRFIPFDTKQ